MNKLFCILSLALFCQLASADERSLTDPPMSDQVVGVGRSTSIKFQYCDFEGATRRAETSAEESARDLCGSEVERISDFVIIKTCKQGGDAHRYVEVIVQAEFKCLRVQ